jgi:hypothetical protein
MYFGLLVFALFFRLKFAVFALLYSLSSQWFNADDLEHKKLKKLHNPQPRFLLA